MSVHDMSNSLCRTISGLTLTLVIAFASAALAQEPGPQLEPASDALPAPEAPAAPPLSPPTSAPEASAARALEPVVALPDARAKDDPREPCECKDRRAATEGAGVFMLGVALLDFSALNDRLAANGYERFPSVLPVIGGEGHAVFKNGFVVGARGAAILAPTSSGPSNLDAELSGGFGMADFGFAFIRTESFLFTLTGGIGGYGLSVRLGEHQPARFDDVLANPRRGTTVDRNGVLVGLNIGIDARIPIGEPDHGGQGFFTLGGRIGGLYGPAIGNWSLPSGADATHGPTTGLVGGYAAFVLGFGGGRVPR